MWWTAENPGLGSTDVLDGFHRQVGQVRESIGAFGGAFHRHVGEIASAWHGPGATAWVALATAAGTRIVNMETELQEAQRAAGRYEQELWEIQSGCAGVRFRIEGARADIEKIQARLAVEMAIDPTGVFALGEQRRLADAHAEIAAAERRLAVLAEQREEADHAFARAVDRVLAADGLMSIPLFPPAVLEAFTIAMASVASPPPAARRFLDFLDEDPSQGRIHGAWSRLSKQDREWLIHHRPVRIGNLDGVPFTARDAANRRELARQLNRIRAARAEAEAELKAAGSLGTAFEEDSILYRIGRETGLSRDAIESMEVLDGQLAKRRDARLVALDYRHGPTRAAIALGDLDTASHVGVFVSGVGSRISKEGQLGRYLDSTAGLRNETAEILTRAEKGTEIEDVATVYWYGYEAPDVGDGTIPGAVTSNRAQAGGPRLASFGEGIEAVNPDARATLVGHSYGSMVSSFALPHTDAFDAFVAFGSPGVNIPEVENYQVPATELYYGRAKGDIVAAGQWHGYDPGLRGFQRLPTWAVGEYTKSEGHSEYLKEGSSFQRSTAAVIAGHPESIPR